MLINTKFNIKLHFIRNCNIVNLIIGYVKDIIKGKFTKLSKFYFNYDGIGYRRY